MKLILLAFLSLLGCGSLEKSADENQASPPSPGVEWGKEPPGDIAGCPGVPEEPEELKNPPIMIVKTISELPPCTAETTDFVILVEEISDIAICLMDKWYYSDNKDQKGIESKS